MAQSESFIEINIMFRGKLYKFIVSFSFCFYCSSNVYSNCLFAGQEFLYDVEKAKHDALRNYVEGRIIFYEVANGVLPERPGFNLDKEEHQCIVHLLYESWVMFDLGADVRKICPDFKTLNEKATKYALIYNKESLRLNPSLGELCLDNKEQLIKNRQQKRS